MLDILLLKLEPINYPHSDFVPIEDNKKFSLKVSDEDSLEFEVKLAHYTSDHGNEFFRRINNDISVFLIDQYSVQRYHGGAKLLPDRSSSVNRYEVECLSKDGDYDHIILVCPDNELVILAGLDFAYQSEADITKDSRGFLFHNVNFLCVKTFFGQFRCINLSVYDELGLDPNFKGQYYALRAERINCSDAVLSHYLHNGLDIEDSEEYTNGIN